MEEKRVPPHSLEAEEAVMGAILLDQKALAKVMEILREEHFYSAANQKVYRAVLDLFNRNVTADLVTVTDWLKQNKLLDGIGGAEYLSNIVGNLLTTANVEHHARVVLDKATKRTIIRTSMELLKNSFEDSESAAELVDYAQNSVFQIKESGLRKDPVHIRSFITGILEAAESMRGDRMITGVETGYYKLDEMTSGFQKGDFVVIAGRPSMGKTAIALNIASYAAIENNVAIGVFSLEMSGEALVQRLLCSEAKVSLRNLRRGSLRNEDWVNLATAAGNLDKAPIYIDDSPMLSMYELKAKARRLKAEHNIEMIMVDYLQLLEGPQTFRTNSRQQEISEISRALKGLAKELDIPVIVVSQLSRMPEHRQDRRPLLADLRESGAIEQDADVVIFLYREEVYDRETEKKGIAEVNIAKQRNGPTGMLELAFQGEYTLFANITFREEERVEEEEYEPF
jgi:replicative DNA helicase